MLSLATGWTVQGSNPGGARFSAPVQTGPGADPASCTMATGSFPGGRKWPGSDADSLTLSSAEVWKQSSAVPLLLVASWAVKREKPTYPLIKYSDSWLGHCATNRNVAGSIADSVIGYDMIYNMIWCYMMWYDVIWCDMMWYDVIWCDMMWCDVMWCDVMWYDTIRYGTI
jgi:hypothetical protein